MNYLRLLFTINMVLAYWVIVPAQNIIPEALSPQNNETITSTSPTFTWTGDPTSTFTLEIFDCTQTGNPPQVSDLNLSAYSAINFGANNFKTIDEIPDDLSGLTYNPDSGTLFGIMNKAPFSIVEIDKNGNVITTGAGNRILNIVSTPNNFDPEDIQWIASDNIFHQFLISDEFNGRIYDINVPKNGNADIDLANSGFITLQGSWMNNNGLEGISYDFRRQTIILAEEFESTGNPTSTVYEIDFPANFDGSVVTPINQVDYTDNLGFDCSIKPPVKDEAFDLSGLAHLSIHPYSLSMGIADHFLMLSHEKEKIYETDLSGQIYGATSFCDTGSSGINDANKLEGIAIDDNGTIYLVAEPNIFYKLENPNLLLNPNSIDDNPIYSAPASSPFTYPSNLDQGESYCWRIIDNTTGVSSDFNSFEIAKPACIDKDRQVLEDFYNTGDGNILGWDLNAPSVAGWDWITVDNEGCVTEIVMTESLLGGEFNGSFPPNFGDLEKLKVLNVQGIGLSGQIPLSFSNLTKLEFINIRSNTFNGTITTQFDNKVNLEVMFIGLNQLTGVLPSSFESMNSLKKLSLGPNPFSGELFDKLQNMPNLESLDVIACGFSGEILPEINTNPKLKWIRLNTNNFSGNLPIELLDLPDLEYFEIALNNFSGQIDPALAALCPFMVNADIGNTFTPLWSDFCAGVRVGSPAKRVTNSCGTDSLALVDLYHSLNGASWTNPWILTDPISTWSGVTYNYYTEKVTTLRLVNQQLTGVLSPSIGCLTELVELDCRINKIEGTIPEEIINLEKLIYIKLNNNNLSGTIPIYLGELVNLVHLELSNNNFSLEIPWQLNGLSKLEHLGLAGNDLGGSIPFISNQLNNLRSLNLQQNRLVGNIPESIYGLQNLTSLNLSSNQLTGRLSKNIGNLSSLTSLRIAFNKLIGNIPIEIASLNNLEQVDIKHNNLEGNIPSAIGDLINLKYLYLNDNQFSKSIPVEFSNLINLRNVWLHNNRLTESLPPNLNNLINLQYINFSNNQFSGCFEDELSFLCPIVSYNNSTSDGNAFYTSWTSFCSGQSGSCTGGTNNQNPTCPSDSIALVSLYNATNGPDWTNQWYFNQPMSAWYGVELHPDGCVKSVELAYNNLQGYLPVSMGSFSSIEHIDLGNNNINSTIPQELAQLSSLKSLRLESNDLFGYLSTNLAYLTSLEYFTVANNKLEGSINVIVNWQNSKVISLFNNNFNGSMPNGLIALNSLENLWLSQNNLSGCYDPTLATLCGQLITSTNEYISDGNQFNADWESFCASGQGVCCSQDIIVVEDMIYTGIYQTDKSLVAKGSIPSDHHPEFRASKSILLDAGFKVASGGMLSIFMNGCQ